MHLDKIVTDIFRDKELNAIKFKNIEIKIKSWQQLVRCIRQQLHKEQHTMCEDTVQPFKREQTWELFQ